MTSVVAAAFAALFAWVAGGRRRTLGQRDGVDRPLERARTVSVVIPARDEARSIGALLDSLRRSTFRPLEVIVVDDESADDTAALALAGGARVVRVAPRPAGWLGKPWACCEGASDARGDVLVFLDADVTLAPAALGALVSEHVACGGLVSVQPFHRTRRPYEQLSAVFNASAVLGSGAWSTVPAWSGWRAVAFGPCLVTGADDYRRVGGHAGVRGEVVEDIALARRYAAAGLPVRCLLGGALVEFRMYPAGVRSLVDGWTKNIAAGAALASRPAVAVTVGWIVATSVVAGSTVVALAGWASGGPVPGRHLVGWALTAVTTASVLRRLGSFHPLTSALFPIPLAAFIVVFLRSALLGARGRPVRWKGRPVPTRSADA